ncbi:hypothetical protein BH10PSE1_BH10PSE1_22970 [soil metagenome]
MSASPAAAQVAWLNCRLAVTFAEQSRTCVGGSLIKAILLPSVCDAINYQSTSEGQSQSQSQTTQSEDYRSANASSLGRYLGIPRETARINLRELVGSGLLREEGGGFGVPPEVITADPLRSAIIAGNEALAAYVETLALIGACGLSPDQRYVAGSRAERTAAWLLATRYVLRVSALFRGLAPGVGLVGQYVFLWAAIETGAPLRLSGDLAEPGRLKLLKPRLGPITPTTLARKMDFPVETVRRHVNRLVSEGLLLKMGDGVDVNLMGRHAMPWRDLLKQSESSARQMIWKMGLAGLIAGPRMPQP